MSGFVKLDCNITTSSLWPDADARHVFITALLMARPHEITEPEEVLDIRTMKSLGWSVPAGWYGLVPCSGLGIIRLEGIGQEEGLSALERLSSPDLDSRSKAFEGRRMVRIDGGYLILNFVAFRDRDLSNRERQKRWRERQKCEGVTALPVTIVTPLRVTEAEAEAEADKDKDLLGLKRPKKKDEFAEAYKAAFDAVFPEPYVWQVADFVQLSKFRKQNPTVTPERFVEVASCCWERGKYTPKASLSIKGLCAGFSQLAAGISAAAGPPKPKASTETHAERLARKQACSRLKVRNA